MVSYLQGAARKLLKEPELVLACGAYIAFNVFAKRFHWDRAKELLNRAKLMLRTGNSETIWCRPSDLPVLSDVFLVEQYAALKPRKGCVVFDVGAHIGSFSLVASRTKAKVVAIEPLPENVAFLRVNMTYNSRNYKIYNVALSDYCGSGFLNRNAASPSETKIGPPHIPIRPGDIVKVVTLDQLVDEAGIDVFGKPVMVKLDVEGSEMAALRGMEKTFAAAKSVELVVELHPPLQARLYEILSFLPDRGFVILGWSRSNGHMILHARKRRKIVK